MLLLIVTEILTLRYIFNENKILTINLLNIPLSSLLED